MTSSVVSDTFSKTYIYQVHLELASQLRTVSHTVSLSATLSPTRPQIQHTVVMAAIRPVFVVAGVGNATGENRIKLCSVL